ncbi:MAG: YtoQ family protein [Planctomycetaceae bacterium]|jgi:YtoQ family protein|nr:YtoQ family protein [Planctomycetaceae bacterium]
MHYTVYLAGEIHTTWRTELAEEVAAASLPVTFLGPVTDHGASDDTGAEILGAESDPFWHDRKGAGVNALRTRTMLAQADLVIVRFGDKYRQWNAAFDAGMAVAMQKPLLVIHPPELQHALKEIDAAACAVAENIQQVVKILGYMARQEAWTSTTT